MTSLPQGRTRPVVAGRGRPLRAVPDRVTPGDVAALRAETQIAALGVSSWPPYGTAAWLQLSPKDPRCYAATLEAAELHRRAETERQRADWLMDNDPEAWWREITADANDYAARQGRAIAARKTAAEIRAAAARASNRPPHQLRATPGWPPIAIPGRPGRYLVHQEQAE
ncbi:MULTISPECIES: hypothetical protein [unclassified Streptomyces]|uniref:hypothetical protein n=1 Tax=unclassified Streptomyces TaxID=2593676 RepID=UPI0036E6379F